MSLNDGRQFQSNKLTIFSFADPQSHSYKVRILLPENEPNLMPGMWAKAKFSAGVIRSITLPKTTLIERGELTAVYRQLEGQFVLNQVRVGRVEGDTIEILSGLDDGDIVALDAYQLLLNKNRK